MILRSGVGGCVKRPWHGIYYAVTEAGFGCFDAGSRVLTPFPMRATDSIFGRFCGVS